MVLLQRILLAWVVCQTAGLRMQAEASRIRPSAAAGLAERWRLAGQVGHLPPASERHTLQLALQNSTSRQADNASGPPRRSSISNTSSSSSSSSSSSAEPLALAASIAPRSVAAAAELESTPLVPQASAAASNGILIHRSDNTSSWRGVVRHAQEADSSPPPLPLRRPEEGPPPPTTHGQGAAPQHRLSFLVSVQHLNIARLRERPVLVGLLRAAVRAVLEHHTGITSLRLSVDLEGGLSTSPARDTASLACAVDVPAGFDAQQVGRRLLQNLEFSTKVSTALLAVPGIQDATSGPIGSPVVREVYIDSTLLPWPEAGSEGWLRILSLQVIAVAMVVFTLLCQYSAPCQRPDWQASPGASIADPSGLTTGLSLYEPVFATSATVH